MSSSTTSHVRISFDDLVIATIAMNLEYEALNGHRGPEFQKLKKHIRDLNEDLGTETCMNFFIALRNVGPVSELWPRHESIFKCDILEGNYTSEDPSLLDFTVDGFIDAGRDMEVEAFAHHIHGKEKPEGWYPCHEEFQFMVDELLAKDYIPYDWLYNHSPEFEHGPHPWDDAPDDRCYVSFVDRLIGLRPQSQINDNVDHYAHSPTNHSPIHTPPKHDWAEQLLKSGKAFEKEMQENGCDEVHPNYQPHPAYTAFFEIWEKICMADLEPRSLIALELDQESTFEWVSLKAPWRLCAYGPPPEQPSTPTAKPTPTPSPSSALAEESNPPSPDPLPAHAQLWPIEQPFDMLDTAEVTPPATPRHK